MMMSRARLTAARRASASPCSTAVAAALQEADDAVIERYHEIDSPRTVQRVFPYNLPFWIPYPFEFWSKPVIGRVKLVHAFELVGKLLHDLVGVVQLCGQTGLLAENQALFRGDFAFSVDSIVLLEFFARAKNSSRRAGARAGEHVVKAWPQLLRSGRSQPRSNSLC